MQANEAAHANIHEMQNNGISLLHVVQKAWCIEDVQARSRKRGWEGKQSQITETFKESQTASCRHWEIIKIWNIIHATFLTKTRKNVSILSYQLGQILLVAYFPFFHHPQNYNFLWGGNVPN